MIPILLFLANYGYSQSGSVTYVVESIKKDNLDSPLVIGIDKELPLKTFKLVYNSQFSFFKKNKNLPINKMYSGFADIMIEAKNSWYQNRLTNEAIREQLIKGELFNVSFNRMKDWQLINETKIIENYVCYKAVRKELNKRVSVGNVKKYIIYEAWYTPDISIPYGPLGNGGLPGLILQLDKKNVARYTAKKIILNKRKNTKIPQPKASSNITVDEMIKLMRNARKVTVD